MSWYEHYVNRMNDRYLMHVREKYKPFIDLIYSHAKNNYEEPKLIEVGCGAANITRILSEKLASSNIVVDICPKMLSLAKQNLKAGGVNFFAMPGDVRNFKLPGMVGEFHVSHSHGLLEHFNDMDILKIVTFQQLMGDTVINYVPSHKYETPSFGDERLMTKDQWYNICKPTEIVEFNDGYDYALIWDKI